MARSSVPKFGNWENQDDSVPYTVYFDKARKNRGGGIMINPNDPEQNPDMFPKVIDPTPLVSRPTPPSTKPKTRPVEPPIGRRVGLPPSREDDDFRQFKNPPARTENPSQRNETNFGGRGQKQARPTRPPSMGSEQSFERSPLYPTYGSNHGNPARPRPLGSNREEIPAKGAAVPKFGDWNTGSDENFTLIFNKVRDEKKNGDGNLAATPKHPAFDSRVPLNNKPKKGRRIPCIPWL